jgi:hypothetical protein
VGSTATGQHQQVPPRVAVGAAEGLGSRKRTRGSVASIALNKVRPHDDKMHCSFSQAVWPSHLTGAGLSIKTRSCQTRLC